MGRFIIKIKDLYCEWSTIVDAPVTYLGTLEQLKLYIKEKYGTEGMDRLKKRLERVEERGTSSFTHGSIEEAISCNRAGDNETELSLDEIYEKYKKESE